MPSSSNLCKEMSINYIKFMLPVDGATTPQILDVGCGCGTYYNLLSPLGYKLDGVEIFQPNIEKFELRSKYQKLYEMNAMDVPPDKHYDLVIFGDVLEHFSAEDARKILDYYKTFCDIILVSVPYELKQDVFEGNVYEIHKQPDLNDKVFKERYPEFTKLIRETEDWLTLAVWIYDGRGMQA